MLAAEYTADYYISSVLPVVADKEIVLTGDYALKYTGCSVTIATPPDVLTDVKELGGTCVHMLVNYHYTPFIEYDKYIDRYLIPMVKLPIRERVFVECIKSDLDYIDEGVFQDSLERYQHSHLFNEPLLKEVAEFFEVDYKKVEYWLNESADYNSF